MGRRIAGTAFLSALQFACSGVVLAQTGADSTACPGCEIRRVLVATLGSDSDSILLGYLAVPSRMTDGRYIAMPDSRSTFMVFDSAGKLVGTSGRKGEGPGEFNGPGRIVVGPGDMLYVAQRGKLDVFSPSLGFVRSIVPRNEGAASPLGIAGAGLVLRSGEIVLPLLIRGGRPAVLRPPDDGNFLHTIRPDGQPVRSFGAAQLRDPDCLPCRSRLMTQADAANEFFALTVDYSIELWTSAGELRRQFAVSSSWIPGGRPTVARPGERPPPTPTGFASDNGNRLWVSGYLTNDRWQPPAYRGVGVTRDGRVVTVGGRGAAIGSIAGITVNETPPSLDNSGFTTAVDAIDPATGRVLATARFEGEVMTMLPDAYAWTKRQDASGVIRIDIWKLELVRRARNDSVAAKADPRVPSTVAEAVSFTLARMSATEKSQLKSMALENVKGLLHGFQMTARHDYGLSDGNPALLRSCGSETMVLEDCLLVILEATWLELNK